MEQVISSRFHTTQTRFCTPASFQQEMENSLNLPTCVPVATQSRPDGKSEKTREATEEVTQNQDGLSLLSTAITSVSNDIDTQY